MDSASPPKRYVPAPPPPLARTETQKRLHLRLELAKPSEFSKHTEGTIVDLLRKTRTPFPMPGIVPADHHRIVEAEAQALEDTLRSFQRELVDRERDLRERELRAAETEAAVVRRAAELAQERALIEGQRKVFESGLSSPEGGSAAISEEQRKALDELQAKLDEQRRAIEEGKQWLQEREAFLEESENTLFEKMQKQQERETELDQLRENLTKREERLNALAEKLRAKGEIV